MHRRLVIVGFVIWLAATAALRLIGQYIVRPTSASRTPLLFLASALAMGWLARHLCKSAGLSRDRWSAAAVSLAAPTLVLDPFSAAFFPVVFPNIPAAAAGVFGGWMLSCCAGALIGTLPRS